MQAVARLRHPNLARMLPLPGGAGLQPILGEAHKLSDFTLPAGTFKRFDLEQIVRLLLDVLAGLSALHEVVSDDEAFVHGEVCPRNVYVDEHGTARLVPLLNVHSAPTKATASGYAAPERLLGSVPDARVDTFSVGVMLWEALAGARLFPDPSLPAVLARQAPPIRLGPRTAWAQRLCPIAERAIAFDPTARFQTAHELSNAIAAAAAQQLSRVDADAWQEEAPTPVFQPRLHLASLRASSPSLSAFSAAPSAAPTPPATPAPAIADSTPGDTVSPTVDAEQALVSAPPRRERRRGRTVALALGASTLALGLVVAALRPSPSAWLAHARKQLSAPDYAPSAAVAARLESPSAASAAPLSNAPVAAMPSVSAASSAVSAPSAAAATATPSASAVAPRSTKPQRAALPVARPQSAPKKPADYGI